MTTAAPNRARIQARCLDAGPSADSPRKLSLRLQLEAVEVLFGGQFLRPGQEVDAIAFDVTSPPRAGEVISAEAEYLGGPRGGVVRLYELRGQV